MHPLIDAVTLPIMRVWTADSLRGLGANWLETPDSEMTRGLFPHDLS